MTALVYFLALGECERGLWCPDCLLPSRVRAPLFMVGENGSSPVTDLDACLECGRSFAAAGP